jgi:hypothetical protein
MTTNRTFVQPEKIPGTSRQRVISTTGKELQRMNVYMTPESWESLEVLSRLYRTSGSKVIARLIEIAVKSSAQ